jgi:hypothetical protein
MMDKIRAIRAWADELERVWRDGARELGLFTEPVYTLPDPVEDEEDGEDEPTPPAGPVPPPPAPPAPIAAPTFAKGRLDPLVWQEIQKVAPTRGVQPETLAAVQVWESAWYTSMLFREGQNVGGIKDTEYARRLPGYVGVYTAADGNKYAMFASWQQGITAHADFLTQKRYDAIRNTDDPIAEVRAIHDAGYAEHERAWLEGVTKLARKFAAMARIPSRATDTAEQVWAAALRLPDPFPYHPDTEEGNLGCANVVSHALIEAGVLSIVELAVRFLDARLQKLGWAEVSTPYKNGDVVVWGPRPGGVHGHVGILGWENNVLMTIQNSSSQRKVIHTPLEGYDRPIIRVLRAPGGTNA